MMRQPSSTLRQGHIEGSFACALAGENYLYLVTYEGEQSVDWHATIYCGRYFSWCSGSLAHSSDDGAPLDEVVRAQVLASIGVMRPY